MASADAPELGGLPSAPAAGSLHRKIASVQSEIGVMPKDRHVDVRKNGQLQYSYDYLSESALMSAVREKLAALNVAVYVSVTDQRREAQLTLVQTALTFADGDTGETFTIYGQGQGADQSDKGVYKATTGAVRYMLWKTFLVPTEGDDPNQPHTVEAERDDAPKTLPDVLAIIDGYVEDGRPWIREAIEEHYVQTGEGYDGDEQTAVEFSSWGDLPRSVQTDAFRRLIRVTEELQAAGDKFEPLADEAKTQALVRLAFSKAFEVEVLGPDPFKPTVPF